MREWYYGHDSAPRGPLTGEEMGEMLADGDIAPGDLIWKEGMPGWEPAIHRPEFFPQLTVQPVANAAGQSQESGSAVPTLSYLMPGSYVQSSVRYVGFWLRCCALVIDALILSPVYVGIDYGLNRSLRGDVEMLVMLISFLAYWIYQATLESSPFRASLGKKALGIVVTDANGDRVKFGRASARQFGKITSLLTLYVGFLMASFTRRKQALHDIIANCLVVHQR